MEWGQLNLQVQSGLRNMMYRILFIFCLSIGLKPLVNAQSDSLKKAMNQLSPVASGEMNVVADSAIVKLEKGTRRYKEIKGYRIQVFLGPHDQVNAERNRFLSLGLPYSVYVKQVVPEQALQVGDFLSRMEMEKHLEALKKYYPKAFGVVDVIEPPRFSGKSQR
jgi:hypothetical protein